MIVRNFVEAFYVHLARIKFPLLFEIVDIFLLFFNEKNGGGKKKNKTKHPTWNYKTHLHLSLNIRVYYYLFRYILIQF